MVKALSIDLRKRVVSAVAGGMSRNQAADRFGVSVASAVRWCSLAKQQGDVRPKAQGGDRKSHRIEAQAAAILAVVEDQPDITLQELQTVLAKRKHTFGVATLWRFFDRHQITLKKSQLMRQSRNVRTL
jgi:transposase